MYFRRYYSVLSYVHIRTYEVRSAVGMYSACTRSLTPFVSLVHIRRTSCVGRLARLSASTFVYLSVCLRVAVHSISLLSTRRPTASSNPGNKGCPPPSLSLSYLVLPSPSPIHPGGGCLHARRAHALHPPATALRQGEGRAP